MKKFIRFGLVGFCNTTITFGVFYLLSEVIGVNYMLSSLVGYALGVVNSFILNKKWTFADTDKRILQQLLKFTVVNLVSLGVNLSVLYIGVEMFHLAKTIAQIMAVGFSIVANFAGSRLFVFAEVDTSIESIDGEINKMPDLQEI